MTVSFYLISWHCCRTNCLEFKKMYLKTLDVVLQILGPVIFVKCLKLFLFFSTRIYPSDMNITVCFSWCCIWFNICLQLLHKPCFQVQVCICGWPPHSFRITVLGIQRKTTVPDSGSTLSLAFTQFHLQRAETPLCVSAIHVRSHQRVWLKTSESRYGLGVGCSFQRKTYIIRCNKGTELLVGMFVESHIGFTIQYSLYFSI